MEKDSPDMVAAVQALREAERASSAAREAQRATRVALHRADEAVVQADRAADLAGTWARTVYEREKRPA